MDDALEAWEVAGHVCIPLPHIHKLFCLEKLGWNGGGNGPSPIF